jgi:hypothetical protein
MEWAQLSRLLHGDGDRVSETLLINKKTWRWVMPKKSIVVLIYHCHKLIDLIYIQEVLGSISTGTPAILTEIYYGFRHSLQANAAIPPPLGKERSRDSSVGIATGYRLHGRGSIPGIVRFFSSPQCPDRIWGPPSLLFNRNRGLFPRG